MRTFRFHSLRSRLLLLLSFFSFSLALLPAADADESLPLGDVVPFENPAWFTGEDVSFFGGIITPSLHVVSAFGGTTAEEQADLAVNGHDPQRSATLQAFEPGLSLRAGNLQGFATYSATTDASQVLDGALEEAFLKVVELPFDTEIRGGQFLNRFGFQNAVHNHGWMFVDQNLVNGRFLNEGELTTIGGELTWNLPVGWGPTALSLSYGGLTSHSHGEEGHEHGEEAEFEVDAANFNNWLASANLVSRYDYNDFHQFTGTASGAWGENEFAKLTQVYGLGFQYEWRENGYEPGGRFLRWRTEAMLRDIEAVSGHGHEHGEEEHHDEEEDDEHAEEEEASETGTFDEFGFYTAVIYGWNDRLETGLRADWVSGIDEFGLESRWRLSPSATWHLDSRNQSHFRLQYNYDHTDTFDEHSVWAQFQFSWGSPEVR